MNFLKFLIYSRIFPEAVILQKVAVFFLEIKTTLKHADMKTQKTFDDVYILDSVPPLKEEDKPRIIKGMSLLSNYNYDQDVKGKNPHSIPDPNLIRLLHQPLPDHKHHR